MNCFIKLYLICALFNQILFLNSYDGKNNPRVTILTSVYNGDAYIRGFLKDIVRQTIFSQCELIMINANSPGNEERIILEYANTYPNIIYKKLPHDPGLYGVWNIGIKMARSAYIINANLDDRLHPECYEVHARTLDSNPMAGVVYSGSYMTTVANEVFDTIKPHWKKMLHTQEEYTKHRMLYGDNPKKARSIPFPHNHPMWRRALHVTYGLFDSRLKAAGDLEMWLRLRLLGNVIFKKIDGYYALYYWNPHGLSTIEFPHSRDSDMKEHTSIDVFYKKIYEERFNQIEFLSF
jgi:glycosyltransferase involved in cell wall biosynthesis